MRLGSIGKTTIDLEVSFIILIGLFVVLDLERGHPWQQALLWIPVLLVSVLVHEFGHAGMLKALGFGHSRIFLAGVGGLTVNERQARPWQDILVSISGPFSSFLLAGMSWVILFSVALAQTDPMLKAFLPLMVWANAVWGVFNLVPIFPLDGGHAVHHLLRTLTTERRAFAISAWSSLLIASGVIALGLIGRQLFVVIIVAMLAMTNYRRIQALRSI